MNNRGNLLVNILIMVMSVTLFIAVIPMLSGVFNIARGCSYLNCAGYIDSSATGAGCSGTNQTYMASYNTESLTCTVLDLGIPFLVLGVIFCAVMMIMYNKNPVETSPDYYG